MGRGTKKHKFDLHELAAYLGRSWWTVNEWVKAKKFNPDDIGSVIRYCHDKKKRGKSDE